MKKFLLISLAVVAVVGVSAFVFREPLVAAAADRLTRDMFIAEDADAFEPGLPVGARMPAVNVRYDGRALNSLAEFMGAQGLVFFAVRSVDW